MGQQISAGTFDPVATVIVALYTLTAHVMNNNKAIHSLATSNKL